jgi:hypothetical protein
MIHSHRPGEHIHIGLNIEFGMRGRWPWITLIWCWYDLANRETYGWRLRIRTHIRPFKLFSIHRQDVVESYLNDHDAFAVPRSLIEDEAPHIERIIRYYKAKREFEGRLDKRQLL